MPSPRPGQTHISNVSAAAAAASSRYARPRAQRDTSATSYPSSDFDAAVAAQAPTGAQNGHARRERTDIEELEEDDDEEFEAGGATTQGEMDPPPSIPPPMPHHHVHGHHSHAQQGALVPAPKGPSRPGTVASQHQKQLSSGSKNGALTQPAAPASTTPLTSLYLVAGLPKSPHTWTLAEPDSVEGCRHADGAVNRWWRAEVLGSTVSPGVNNGGDGSTVGGGKKRKSRRGEDVQRMLSKALKLSFPKEVEIIASTLQPASTIHTFTFTLRPAGPHSMNRAATFTSLSNASSLPSLRPGYGPANYSTTSFQSFNPPPVPNSNNAPLKGGKKEEEEGQIYYGTVLTVYSHADASRAEAIRKSLSQPTTGTPGASPGSRRFQRRPASSARRKAPWNGQSTPEATETEQEPETDDWGDKVVGGSTLFLPRETVFWLPYALTLVSKHPIYDLMRDFLTLSWARFSKDVQSHSLQIAKILEHPSPRSGDIVKLDAGAEGESVEVVCRFPGGLDFGRGLVDVNFTMWPLFRALNLDNILTVCEIALAATGRVLFLSRYPAMLGIAVHTIKYIVELRGWNGIAHPAVHARDAKIYLEDPGPWLIGLHTDCRFVARPSKEVCICDLDINSVHCPSPPAGSVSTKQQRDKFRRTLINAFEGYFHPDYAVPSEFKEAFPAGRFRPLCSIKTRRGAPSAVYAEIIPPPEWWFQPRVIQAFDSVLKDKYKKPSLLKRLAMLGMSKRQAGLTAAEQLIQRAIRRRATAFVDARDDLETKIGRLSRRLNFLMTESDLWREKFVAFEGYAEKLSLEAGDLKSKIGKEQRESRRLSGLITVTAQEKQQLQMRLSHVEHEHQDALMQLDQMRLNMEAMEREREQMVAEVEEQIERALASMSFNDSMSETGTSRTGSRADSRASTPGLANGRRIPRSFSTGTALHDPVDEELVEHEIGMNAADIETGKRRLEKIDEREIDEEEAEVKLEPRRQRHYKEQKYDEEHDSDRSAIPVRKKRFSASGRDQGTEDTMGAVDAGISEKSERISEKVNQIQMKLELALADLENKRRVASPRSGADDTGGETDATRRSRRTRRRVKTSHSAHQAEAEAEADTSLEQRLEQAPPAGDRLEPLHSTVEQRLSPALSRAEKKRSLDEMSEATYRPSAAERSGEIDEPDLEPVPEMINEVVEPVDIANEEEAVIEPVDHAEDADSEASSQRDIKRESTSTVVAEPAQTPIKSASTPSPIAPPRNPSRAPPVSSSGRAAAILVQETPMDAAAPALSRKTSTRSKRLSRMTTGTTSGGESDADFVSAYSSSPIDKSLMDDEDDEGEGMSPVPGSWDDDEDLVEPRHIRQRVSSTATEVPDSRRYRSFNAVSMH
ncbi:hypothetical protein DACRYDRAFT_66769 [Dacryopinax primogenitus]|uniref:UDENN domain-containing protein n=1 Tax=Dacryopinax primogenitus (strain DJM 731) TaxID=1858805 RepID=M5G7I0_DACPD|nr:uncharacterized protein DACRYDRAFT_66769 [Dacryopinax primogenitus]EJU01827.1 hypothetical protein DACRYDRAFT_66769 [Dacryopinax primogenitus]